MFLSTLLLCFTLYLSAISKFKSPVAYIRKGRFNGGFFAIYVWRDLYMEALIFVILRYIDLKESFIDLFIGNTHY